MTTFGHALSFELEQVRLVPLSSYGPIPLRPKKYWSLLQEMCTVVAHTKRSPFIAEQMLQKDLALYYDFETMRSSGVSTESLTSLEVQNHLSFIEREDSFLCAIVVDEDGQQRVIGRCMLKNIQRRPHLTAELSIMLSAGIMRQKLQVPVGTTVIKQLCQMAFSELSLDFAGVADEITLGVYSDNTRAIRCYRGVGFVEFGRTDTCMENVFRFDSSTGAMRKADNVHGVFMRLSREQWLQAQ